MDKPATLEIVGIKPWKRWQIDPFLRASNLRLRYTKSADQALENQAQHGGEIAIWAAREPDDFAERASAQKVSVIRIEDGFLRSVGLGSNHVGGASLVIDREGIYFDPRRPSALERLLQTDVFDSRSLARAERLRRRLVDTGITKYNTGKREPLTVGGAAGQRKVLVPGQVEDDASIRLGSPKINRNLDLLRHVRAAEPDAWIVYKPHPDTEAQTRAGYIPDQEVLRLANQIVRDVSVVAVFSQIDAVHTMTSLVGFEALLRGVAVTTWGLPFYAGWGLTEDHLPQPRRTRRLSIDMLTAGALISYPRYIDPETGLNCEAEQIVERLALQPTSNAVVDRSRFRRYAQLGIGLYRSWKSAYGLR